LARGAALFVALAAVTALPRTADASGFLTAKFGSDHGNPMTGNPYAVYFNPAALGGVNASMLTLDGSFAYRTVDYTRSEGALTPSTSQLKGDPQYRDANTGAAHLGNFAVGPYGGFASNLGTKWLSIGLASYVPFGGAASWDKNKKYVGNLSVPGAQDGPQRWHSISGSAISWYNTAAIALTIPTARLSFGLSGSYIRHTVATTRSRNLDGYDDMRDRTGSLIEGSSYLDVKGSSLGLGMGLYWEPLEDRSLRLGASYTTRPGFGQMRLSGTLATQFGNQKADQNFEVDFLQTYPDILRFGVAWRVSDDVELRADTEYVRWSAFSRQCVVLKGKSCNLTPDGAVNTDKSSSNDVIQNVPRNWRDAVGVRLGASNWLNRQTEIFLSGGIDTSAAPVETMDATFPDAFKVQGTVGVRRLVTRNFSLAGSYNQIYYLPVETSGKSILGTQQYPSRSPSGDGRYEQQVVFINVNATYIF
jgi:long-chain fatty acid transport protein